MNLNLNPPPMIGTMVDINKRHVTLKYPSTQTQLRQATVVRRCWRVGESFVVPQQ
jgi:hypothetical protein